MSVCVSVCVLCWHCRMETRATLQETPHFVCRNSAMHKLRTPGACVRDSRDLFACREECVWCRHTRSGGEGARCKWAARAQKIRCLSPPSVVSLAEWTNELDISSSYPHSVKDFVWSHSQPKVTRSPRPLAFRSPPSFHSTASSRSPSSPAIQLLPHTSQQHQPPAIPRASSCPRANLWTLDMPGSSIGR